MMDRDLCGCVQVCAQVVCIEHFDTRHETLYKDAKLSLPHSTHKDVCTCVYELIPHSTHTDLCTCVYELTTSFLKTSSWKTVQGVAALAWVLVVAQE